MITDHQAVAAAWRSLAEDGNTLAEGFVRFLDNIRNATPADQAFRAAINHCALVLPKTVAELRALIEATLPYVDDRTFFEGQTTP